jgi:hypothetical protein
MVYSVSIFSHISEEHALLWLREFGRIVRPGGLACLTTLGLPALRTKMGLDEISERILHQQGHFHKAYDFNVKRRASRTEKAAYFDESYGRTFYTPDYIREHWQLPQWQVVGIAEGTIDALQDLVVLKRI